MSSRSRGVVLCASLVVLCSWSATGEARPIVVVAPFRGPRTEGAQTAALRGLRKFATVLSPQRYAAVARGIVAKTQSADDVAAVAQELSARWVVTGTLAREGGHWALGVSLRDGYTGHVRSRLRYNLSSPRCPPALLRTLASEIGDALADAEASAPREAGGAPVHPPDDPNKHKVEPDEHEKPPVGPGDVHPTNPPVVTPPPVAHPAPSPTTARPRWAHWFELGVGPSLTSRAFATSSPPPRFSASVQGGLHGDFTVYPLAFTWNKLHGIFSGVGLAASIDKPFWPASTPQDSPTTHFATSELRVEGGLHWKFTLYKPMPRPQLTLIVGGGLHEFLFAQGPTGNGVGVPDVQYVYASLGGTLTLHFADWSWLWASFVYHIVPKFGPIEAQSEYGPAKGYGFRFSGGLDFLVWKGLRVGVQGFYERFTILFGYDRLQAPANIADSATDEYYGALLVLGYVY